jgi:hypothetical protein
MSAETLLGRRRTVSDYLIGNAHLFNRIGPNTGRGFPDRKRHNDDKATGLLKFPPTETERFLWSRDRIVAVRAFYDFRLDGLTVRAAARIANKIWEGIQMHPVADQMVIVTLENGSTSVHPVEAVDLRSGFIGGVHMASALIVDVRNLRARIDRAVQADAQIVGEIDDA